MPWVTVWLLVYQRLNSNATLATAVTELLGSIESLGVINKRACEGKLSSNTGSYRSCHDGGVAFVTACATWSATASSRTVSDATGPGCSCRCSTTACPLVLDGPQLALEIG